MGLGHQLAESSKARVPGCLESSGWLRAWARDGVCSIIQYQRRAKAEQAAVENPRLQERGGGGEHEGERWEIGRNETTTQGQIAGMARRDVSKKGVEGDWRQRRVWNRYEYKYG
ncbi:hypothetical protein J3F83DRAFT_753716 [Trichoderma novae-zelandiae]